MCGLKGVGGCLFLNDGQEGIKKGAKRREEGRRDNNATSG